MPTRKGQTPFRSDYFTRMPVCFPDQTSAFLNEAQALTTRSMGRTINVLAPLAAFHTADDHPLIGKEFWRCDNHVLQDLLAWLSRGW